MMPEVVEFCRMAGEIDCLIELQLRDTEAHDAVYRQLNGATAGRERRLRDARTQTDQRPAAAARGARLP